MVKNLKVMDKWLKRPAYATPSCSSMNCNTIHFYLDKASFFYIAPVNNKTVQSVNKTNML